MKKIFSIIFFLLIVGIFLYASTRVGLELYYRNKEIKYAEEISEKNQKCVFRISKIIKHSSADAVNIGDSLDKFNIHQFSDISIFIDNKIDSEELTDENIIKELYLDNFTIEKCNLGKEQNLYYKNPYNMGKFRKLDFNKIEDKLNYEIIFKNEENREEYYDKPVFYTDCSNPISIGYINENVYENYSVKKNGSVYYDGRILKDLKLDLDKLKTKIGFTVHIKNNLNEEFICNINMNINLKNSTESVYSGYFAEIIETEENLYKFFKL